MPQVDQLAQRRDARRRAVAGSGRRRRRRCPAAASARPPRAQRVAQIDADPRHVAASLLVRHRVEHAPVGDFLGGRRLAHLLVFLHVQLAGVDLDDLALLALVFR